MKSSTGLRSRTFKRRRFLLLIGLPALALVVLGWSIFAVREQLAIRREATLAREALANQRWTDAREAINRWTRMRPRDPEPHFLKARIALAEGNGKESADELTLARELGYPLVAINRFDGLVKARIGRKAEAEPVLAQTFESTSEPDPELYESLARIYLETYRFGPASRILDRWIRDVPRDAKPYLWYTEIDTRAKAGPAVIEGHFKAALERDPNLDAARLGLAEILRKDGRPRDAEPEYERYLSRNGKDVVALVGAARNAVALDNEPAAIRHLEQALAVAPDDSEALRELAAIDQRHGNYARALERLNRALRTDPFDIEALYSRSLALARLGRTNDSRADQRKMHELKREREELVKMRDQLLTEPRNVDVQYRLARWYLSHGREEEGKRMAELIVASHTDFGPANRLLADFYDRHGDVGRANFYRMRASPNEGEQPGQSGR